ncbi:hypothetical protein B0H19DRAFT_1124700 [Mycena capillaripes]|nr:hypothetical protein B0H19DRAFT_1124700 [Mycena capillaripes]
MLVFAYLVIQDLSVLQFASLGRLPVAILLLLSIPSSRACIRTSPLGACPLALAFYISDLRAARLPGSKVHG